MTTDEPSNGEVADAFALLGDLLAIEGADRHRIRAYHRGAERIRATRESVVALARAGTAVALPDIGATLQAKIVEFADTGTMQALEAARARVPEGLVMMARLPGVGPARAIALWRTLDVDSLDGLREVAAAGRLTDVPGIGPRLADEITTSLARSDEAPTTPRFGAGVALPLAEALVAHLRTHPAVVRAEVAGSLRRGREDAHDIDIVVASDDPEAVLDHAANADPVARIASRGERTIALDTQPGIRAEIAVAEPGRFGNLLQHATGSAAHNTRLRERAKRAGISLSQHGWSGSAGDDGSDDEADVYRLLGLTSMAPELREDRGEIEQAADGAHPPLIEQTDLCGEVHVHSTWSDGRATIAEMAAAARARGYRYLGIADHSQSLAMTNGLTRERVYAQWQEIDALNETFDDGFRVLKCTEMDILGDGRLDFDDDLLEGFDCVVASIHNQVQQSPARITERLLAAIASPHVDVIGHPTGRMRGRREGVAIDIDRIVEAAADTGTVLEINAQPRRQDLDSDFARTAREAGVRLLISSDAHSVAELDVVRYGIRIARRAGATPADVVNTGPWPWRGAT